MIYGFFWVIQSLLRNFIQIILMGIVFTGFPQFNIHFHDSGVGGDTIPKAIVRFDWDVAL